jgi:PadR family transcriptional regulator PadR
MRNIRILGDFEQLVLLAVLRLGEEAYGITITDEITARTGCRVAQGSVYTTLNRLENKGLLRSHRGEPLPVRGGRSRRFYRIEPEGKQALEAARLTLADMWRGLEPGTEPV